jgi:hypothetical protein
MTTNSGLLEHYGFERWDTGGNCVAWGKRCQTSGYVLITDDSGMDVHSDGVDPDSAEWLVGCYDDDGDEVSCLNATSTLAAINAGLVWVRGQR